MAYGVQFDDGWELVSADTRTRALMASDAVGIFPKKDAGSIQMWLETLYEEIYMISSVSEEELQSQLSDDAITKMACYQKDWDAILHPERIMTPSTKVIPGGDGYELIGVAVDTVLYDERPHLIDVHWHQSAPFNRYCPFRSGSDWDHAPAGCGAVACAQMLLYLHDKIGVPAEAPDSAYVYGHTAFYIMEQYGASTTIWDEMRGDIFECAPSIFVAYVGKMLNTRYGDNSSSVSPASLVSLCFNPLGIDCHLTNYDSEVLSSQLFFGCPAIVYAFENDYTNSGHAFIIDGYKRHQVRHIYTYRKTNASGSMFQPTYTNIIVDLPVVTDYCMNWGQGAGFDHGYYSVGGDWNLCGANYIHNRHMICDFFDIAEY